MIKKGTFIDENSYVISVQKDGKYHYNASNCVNAEGLRHPLDAVLKDNQAWCECMLKAMVVGLSNRPLTSLEEILYLTNLGATANLGAVYEDMKGGVKLTYLELKEALFNAVILMQFCYIGGLGELTFTEEGTIALGGLSFSDSSIVAALSAKRMAENHPLEVAKDFLKSYPKSELYPEVKKKKRATTYWVGNIEVDLFKERHIRLLAADNSYDSEKSIMKQAHELVRREVITALINQHEVELSEGIIGIIPFNLLLNALDGGWATEKDDLIKIPTSTRLDDVILIAKLHEDDGEGSSIKKAIKTLKKL